MNCRVFGLDVSSQDLRLKPIVLGLLSACPNGTILRCQIVGNSCFNFLRQSDDTFALTRSGLLRVASSTKVTEDFNRGANVPTCHLQDSACYNVLRDSCWTRTSLLLINQSGASVQQSRLRGVTLRLPDVPGTAMNCFSSSPKVQMISDARKHVWSKNVLRSFCWTRTPLPLRIESLPPNQAISTSRCTAPKLEPRQTASR